VESALEVRYSGVVVGRGVPIRDRDAGGAFVVLAEPLPVGTRITLRGEGAEAEEQGRVTAVTESANPDLAGMRIEFLSASAKPAPKQDNPPASEPPPPAVSEPPSEMKMPPVAEPPPPATVKPPVVEEQPQPYKPPVADTGAAPVEVASSDSTASSANPQDPGLGGSGKRRRRRR
jgi:hypothetical protein